MRCLTVVVLVVGGVGRSDGGNGGVGGVYMYMLYTYMCRCVQAQEDSKCPTVSLST